MKTRLGDHLGRRLAAHGAGQPRLWVLDGDLADSDGAIHFAEAHPERFLMGGIAEQNLVSVAAGMAHGGLQPWVFSFAAFLAFRACDQIRCCLSQAGQPVVLVGSHSGGLSGRNGKTHSALDDLAVMLALPGLHVWSPADRGDVELAVDTLVAAPAPAYVRLPRRPIDDDVVLPGAPAPLRWLRERRPLTLVATGLATHWALAAADRLAARGLDVGVLHVAQLAPRPPLVAALAGVEHVVTIEDHHVFGGLASLVHQVGLDASVTAYGWPAAWSGKSGGDDELLALHGLSGDGLAESIHARVGRSGIAVVRR